MIKWKFYGLDGRGLRWREGLSSTLWKKDQSCGGGPVIISVCASTKSLILKSTGPRTDSSVRAEAQEQGIR